MVYPKLDLMCEEITNIAQSNASPKKNLDKVSWNQAKPGLSD